MPFLDRKELPGQLALWDQPEDPYQDFRQRWIATSEATISDSQPSLPPSTRHRAVLNLS